MRSIWMLVPIAALLFACSSARTPQPPPSQYDPHAAFAETDTNRDDAIDRQEFYVRIVEVFYRADGNKDGFLSVEEITLLAFPDDMKDADSNHDGRLTVHEFVRVRALDFEEADGDKDGLLSIQEVVAAYDVRTAK